MDEESYFNTPDEEEETPLAIGTVNTSSSVSTAGTSNLSPTSRKRVSDSIIEDETSPISGRKKVRFQNESPDRGIEGIKPLPRSKTWPSFESDKMKGLVDYGEEEDDDEDPSLAGGFIRQKEAAPSSSENGGGPLKLSPAFTLLPSVVLGPTNGTGGKPSLSTSLPPSTQADILPPMSMEGTSEEEADDAEPPQFKRRRPSLDDDDDDTLGLISKGKKPATSAAKGVIGSGVGLGVGLVPGGGLLGVKKISFGGTFSKLVEEGKGNGGKAEEISGSADVKNGKEEAGGGAGNGKGVKEEEESH